MIKRTFLLVLLWSIWTVSFAGSQGGCGDEAVFQVDNQTHYFISFSDLKGDILVDTTILGEGKTNVATISSLCESDVCEINTGSFSVGMCEFKNINIKIEKQNIPDKRCVIISHEIEYSDYSTSKSCNITFDEEHKEASHPIMHINHG